MNGEAMDLTVKDVARILGISIGTVRKWTDEGYIEASRTPGGHRRYSQDDIDAFLKKIRPRDHPD
jgi:excisionase family DNA binding protein